jgi:cytoskeletal protein CcmA (bactofilin family)
MRGGTRHIAATNGRDSARFNRRDQSASMFGKKTDKTVPTRSNDLSAFIDEASEIEGKYTFSGTVMLNGKFKGEIVSNDTLIVGEKAIINASIRAGVVLISGEVVGNVLATERVELRGTARVFGDVEAPVIVVEEGVRFEGHCRMTKPHAADAADDASTTHDEPAVRLKR